MITLTIPKDDHIALRAFSKALEEMALAHEPAINTGIEIKFPVTRHASTTDGEPEIDTTAQQVESLSPEGFHISLASAPFGTDPNTIPEDAGVEITGFASTDADSAGTPWDERIHSTSKARNADGTWRLRRKPKDKTEEEWADYIKWVQEDIHLTIDEDELSDPEPDTGALVGTVEPPVTPPGDDFHTDADVVTEQTIAGIPPLPVPPPLGGSGDRSFQSAPHKLVGSGDDLSSGGVGGIPPVAPPAVVVAPPAPEVTTWDFPRLMTFLTERHGKIDVATVNTLLAQDGMSSVQELNTNPDKIGSFVARVKAHLGE